MKYLVKRTINYVNRDGRECTDTFLYGNGVTLIPEVPNNIKKEYGMAKSTALKKMSTLKGVLPLNEFGVTDTYELLNIEN